MWQGNAVNVLKGTPQSTLQCLIYAQVRHMVADRLSLARDAMFRNRFPVSDRRAHSDLLFFSAQMKVYTQNRTQETLTVQQRFGLGCVSGAVAHAAFYPLEVSEISGRSECFNISVLSCPFLC